MEIIMAVILIAIIGLMGYLFINRVGTIFDENAEIINEYKRTKLIYIGFDMPCLVEDFLTKVDELDNSHNSVEVMIYAGTSDEIMKKLEEGAVDYAVITENNLINDIGQVHRKEISLKPEKLRTDVSNMRIDMINCDYIKASALWIPDKIVREKMFFANLILKL